MENKFNFGPIPPGGEEYPFYREGMTPEEWETEREHYMEQFAEELNRLYGDKS